MAVVGRDGQKPRAPHRLLGIPRSPDPGGAQGRSILQSPIVIVTGVASLVMLLAAVILIVFGGE